MKKTSLIACCGLDCGECDMREAAGNPEMQRQFAQWFKDNMKLDVAPEEVRCSGCHGPRASHWNPNCWILVCCVKDHGRDHCSECPEFACRKLGDWAAQSLRYTAALERLYTMRAAQQP